SRESVHCLDQNIARLLLQEITFSTRMKADPAQWLAEDNFWNNQKGVATCL
ncbi:hypothetical protein LCGC14_2921770, partial [marine sediment metagenome]